MNIIFNSSNSTNQTALIIGNKFGFLPNEEAQRIFESIDVESSAFGSAQLIPANTKYASAQYDLIELDAIDIKQHIVDCIAYDKVRSEAINAFSNQAKDVFEFMDEEKSNEFINAYLAERNVVKPF